MAMNSAECEQMLESADHAGVLLGIAHNFRFNRSVNRLREIVAAGKIGRAVVARSEFHYLTRNSARTWINDASLACGGPIGDVAVHCVDTLRYILQDEVASVYARALYDEESGGVEYAASLMLELQKGTIATVTVSTRAEYRSPLWITGDAGLAGAEDALNVEQPLDLICKPLGGDSIIERISNQDSYTEQVDAFALSIERGVPFAVPGIEGLKNQRVLDAAYRSIKTGNREEI
jgi:predicted dehydrogenase